MRHFEKVLHFVCGNDSRTVAVFVMSGEGITTPRSDTLHNLLDDLEEEGNLNEDHEADLERLTGGILRSHVEVGLVNPVPSAEEAASPRAQRKTTEK